MPCCSAVNCSNTHEKGFRMFCFPREETRRKQWIEYVRRNNWNPTISSRLCELHFEASQFESHRLDGVKKLKPNAVPTLLNISNSPKRLDLPPRKPVHKKRINVDSNEINPTTLQPNNLSVDILQKVPGNAPENVPGIAPSDPTNFPNSANQPSTMSHDFDDSNIPNEDSNEGSDLENSNDASYKNSGDENMPEDNELNKDIKYIPQLARSSIHARVPGNSTLPIIYQCSLCPAQSRWRSRLKRHFTSCLKRSGDALPKLNFGRETKRITNCAKFRCEYCYMTTKSLDVLLRHKKEEHVEQIQTGLVECSHCSSTFFTFEELKIHMENLDKSGAENESVRHWSVEQRSAISRNETSLDDLESKLEAIHNNNKEFSDIDANIPNEEFLEITDDWISALGDNVIILNNDEEKKDEAVTIKLVDENLQEINPTEQSPPKATENMLFKCSICKTTLSNRKYLNIHSKAHGEELNEPYIKIRYIILKDGVHEGHITIKYPPVAISEYSCTECNFKTRDEGLLMKHEKLHWNKEKEAVYMKQKCGMCLFQTCDKEEFRKHCDKHKMDI